MEKKLRNTIVTLNGEIRIIGGAVTEEEANISGLGSIMLTDEELAAYRENLEAYLYWQRRLFKGE